MAKTNNFKYVIIAILILVGFVLITNIELGTQALLATGGTIDNCGTHMHLVTFAGDWDPIIVKRDPHNLVTGAFTVECYGLDDKTICNYGEEPIVSVDGTDKEVQLQFKSIWVTDATGERIKRIPVIYLLWHGPGITADSTECSNIAELKSKISTASTVEETTEQRTEEIGSFESATLQPGMSYTTRFNVSVADLQPGEYATLNFKVVGGNENDSISKDFEFKFKKEG